jgi:CHAT domain-containing protein
VVYVLRDLGIVAFQKGDPAAAKAYYQRALSLQKRLAPNPRSEASILHRLGMLAQVQGDLREAERCSRRAWELVCEEAATVAGDEARQAFGATIADFAAVLMRTQMLLGQSDKAWLTLEQSRAQALQQLLSERDLLVHGAPGRLQAAYREAVAARDRAEQEAGGISAAGTRAQRTLAAAEEAHAGAEVIRASRAAVASAAQQQAEAQSAYVAARLKTEELWRKIRQSAPRAFPERLTEMARHSLLAGSLFVAFAVDEEGAFLFLLRPLDGRKLVASFVPIGIPSKELRTRVEAFRSQLTDPEVAAGETAAAGRELFAKLFPPEARQEIQSARRLLISPDGPLWDLPFAALVTNAGGAPRYLGTSKPITYTQSLTLFAQSRRDAPHLASGARPRVVVVGNPRFQRAPMLLASGAAVRGEREYLLLDARPPAPLPATGREAAAIAQLYGTVPLTDAAATEAALRAGIGRADVIHLATHGYLHPVRPMSSGVLLAAPAAKPEIGETRNDGVLQAWEVYSQLQLKAELVVLSACETGRGKNVPGEGIVGLTRALQYAGARSIVASQWKVADTSTTTLMIRLHRRLREGVAKDEALRQAMAAVQGNPQTAHPYYWSAFFLTGDPDNPNLGAARTAGGISQRPSRRGSAPVRSRQGSGKAVR